MNYHIKKTHISQIAVGDTVEINGVLKTVCAHNIKKGFMGITLFGDSYRLGTLPVNLAIIEIGA